MAGPRDERFCTQLAHTPQLSSNSPISPESVWGGSHRWAYNGSVNIAVNGPSELLVGGEQCGEPPVEGQVGDAGYNATGNEQ